MSKRRIPRSVQFVGCQRCGETEKTLRRVDGALLCLRCAGAPVSGSRGMRHGPLVLREIRIDDKEE